MALEIRKKDRENAQSLVRRFTRSVQQSGILLRARKMRFKTREKSKAIKKREALWKEKKKKEVEKLKKLGKI